MLALLAVVALQAAADNSLLQKGEALFLEYQYAEARAVLAKARAAKGVSRAELLRILELSAIAAAQQRQSDAAQAAFTELLTLDPEHKLADEYAPRVMTPFYEAKRVVNERGALELAVDVAGTAEAVNSLTVRVVRDPLAAAKAVRFHLGGASTVVPLSAKVAQLPTSGTPVRWWAELLGDNEAQLMLLGSEAEPRVDQATATAQATVSTGAAAEPKDTPAEPSPKGPTPAPVEAVRAAPAKGSSLVRTLSYPVFAAGLVSVGVAGVFTYRWSDAYDRLAHPTTDAQGRITSLTERDVPALTAQLQQSAGVANALYVTAAALAVAAVLLFVLGG